uniref:Taste receptor type 2 n=1 Tax=Erpetoichthys calabaricus TaxID=27687 RepID=A0A8C4X5S8_ERPCA
MLPSTFFSVLVVSSVGGVLSHLFIVLCLFLPQGEEGKKKLGQSVTLAYRYVAGSNLLFCLSNPGVSFQCLQKNFCFDHRIISQLLFVFNCMTLYCTIWFTAILCLFYCIKILQSVNSLFLKLKSNISMLLRWSMASGILVNSFSSSYIFLMDTCRLLIIQNKTDTNVQNSPSNVFMEALYGLFYIIFPSVVTLLSCLTIMIYLCRHIIKIKNRLKDTQSCLERQRRVVILFSTQLFLYIVIIVSSLKSYSFYTICKEANYVFFEVNSLCCWAMAANLILQNRFLRWKLENILTSFRQLVLRIKQKC